MAKRRRNAGRAIKRRERKSESKNVAVQALDPQVTESIVRSALTIGENLGFDGLTVESIAAHSGVAKTTIYRRWPDVWSVVSHAFFEEVTRIAPIEQCATARESLHVSMLNLANACNGRFGKILRSLLGRAQVDADLGKAVEVGWFEPRRRLAGAIILRGMESGELRADLDVDIALDVIVGIFYQRIMGARFDLALTERYIDNLLDAVLAGLAPAGA
jgi:AcrR family transcriptional regulator